MITMTVRAAAKAKEIATDEGLVGKPLRMRVIGGGCAGFSYDLFFEEGEPTDMDEVFDCHDVKLIVDPLSFQYLDGTEVDYVEEPRSSTSRASSSSTQTPRGPAAAGRASAPRGPGPTGPECRSRTP